MDKNLAIRIEGLGKRYQLGNTVDLSRTFRETIMSLPKFFGNKAKNAAKNAVTSPNSEMVQADGTIAEYDPDTPPGTFWALRDLNLEIKQGEVVGIIGRNGAGKSTLLKILSRITTPTTGIVEVRGRVGALLEVGTGMHPELTGRENIYLNGSILGMRRHEINRKFDEIVDFSGVEQFLDTPVKRYSSGMRVRLAFAVAAHLDPEILVIDEVLAVGDAEFRKKCLGKMDEVAKGGRTVLFVSHNMAAIQNLCTQSILLDKGRVTFYGNVHQAQNLYLQQQKEVDRISIKKRQDRSGSGIVRATLLEVLDVETNQEASIHCGSRLKIKLQWQSETEFVNPRIILGLYDLVGLSVFRIDTDKTRDLPDKLPASGTVICETGPINIPAGTLSLNLAVFSSGVMADYVINAYQFDITSSDFYGSGQIFEEHEVRFLLEQKWRVDT